MLAGFGLAAIAGMRCKIAHRAVAPVIHQGFALDGTQDFSIIKFKNRQQLYGCDPQLLEIGDFLNHAPKGTGMLNAGCRRFCKATDVHFVDNRVTHQTVERLIALPVVVFDIDDDTAN